MPLKRKILQLVGQVSSHPGLISLEKTFLDNVMVRSNHIFYDLREGLGSPKLLLPLLVVAGFFTFFISFQFVYVFALLYGVIFAARALIGRRCPQCDGPLQEVEAERDKSDAFIMHVIWRCPRDGYQEKETIKGGSGLFGGG